jgi:hypothetical protein
MRREEFKQCTNYHIISKAILKTAVTVNLSAVMISFLLLKTIFKKHSPFSPIKLITDISLFTLGNYMGGLYISSSIADQVRRSKKEYLSIFD